jgi:uridine kinase
MEAKIVMYIIGLGGPTCTGKTTVAKSAATRLGGQTISMESYYLDHSALPVNQRAKLNFDVPEAVDSDLLLQHIREFATGNDIHVPVYDFAEHQRVAGRQEVVKNAPLLIVEGILVLHWPELRSRFDLCVYLDAPDAVCFQRRRVRDIVERQRTHDFIKQQYDGSVQPMAEKYVYPTKHYADVVIDATQSVRAVESELVKHIRAHHS